jgi:hypothetical protein
VYGAGSVSSFSTCRYSPNGKIFFGFERQNDKCFVEYRDACSPFEELFLGWIPFCFYFVVCIDQRAQRPIPWSVELASVKAGGSGLYEITKDKGDEK